MEMEIKKAEFVISAVKKAQYPEDGRPEIAFVGRSNVGKSTLINTLTNRRKLVKVSSTPGKTRLINFFLINENMYFVDLPGYGYAKVSKKEKENWGYIMEQYLVERDQLKKIVLLVDSRHKPTSDDINMYNWIKHYNYEVLVVGTKLDKLKRNDINKNKKIIRDTLKMDKDDKILLISSLNKEGKEEVLEQILVY
ncbi:YihA family ribosome biogenesis GTP-binding protein [Clostridium sporogenes]|uniref:Probable GTP-binding protein EngB n=2 Tax=Clostridium TaxID=1485 RepID=A0AAE4Z3Q0_CLOSG|nr:MULTISPECIES: ribosome biogenesis GTP-binding protein YihA/YsxC [Clostridium]MBE6078830.1 YihA family ribosome biogenesis GTP-binding protein [Clostridium lundense]MDU2834077.1 ribosome biogenesis GTP-binding protein YihA/YsxC [Clostridium botulinum]MCW7996975.1 YihA family ribosome biogenesis GTP-binding protein [Clostridium sp. cpc1]MDU4547477.1 ribosome biogenesis GTP-binding protein YihA/YsxC [Clostridium botulinum]MDU5012607.1 ribosome biogenesis GTP-binding protein YihA/YsxC [Clostrid